MTNKKTHPFDEALQLSGANNSYSGHTSPAYANMRGPFGGITAAVLLKAILEHPEHLGDPLSLTVNYAAPVQDGAFTIQTQLMRTNRSTQHWFVTLAQAETIAATATAVFAKRRPTWGATERPFPTIPPMEQCDSLLPSFLPPWTKQYELRLKGGTAKLFASDADKGSSETVQWIQDKPPRLLDFASLTAICDVFFPRIFVRLGQFMPIGTVSLTIYFHVDAATLSAHGDAPLIGAARANRFGNSYFDQAAEIWTPAGNLLATTHQIVYFKG